MIEWDCFEEVSIVVLKSSKLDHATLYHSILRFTGTSRNMP